MFHYAYSTEQLEKKASELIRQYDPQRILIPKPIDVYDVIDKILGVPHEHVYLSPDQKILGMTAFEDIEWFCWPYPWCPDDLYEHMESNCLTDTEKKYLPIRRHFSKGTILIENTLTETGANIGRHNFTVMHEVIHQFLHKKEFSRIPQNLEHYSTKETFGSNGHKNLESHLDFIEFQANYCAASFLMPRIAIQNYWQSHAAYFADTTEQRIREIADAFSVSKEAMRYRLREPRRKTGKRSSNFFRTVPIKFRVS